jgi:hypothetical protein
LPTPCAAPGSDLTPRRSRANRARACPRAPAPGRRPTRHCSGAAPARSRGPWSLAHRPGPDAEQLLRHSPRCIRCMSFCARPDLRLSKEPAVPDAQRRCPGWCGPDVNSLPTRPRFLMTLRPLAHAARGLIRSTVGATAGTSSGIGQPAMTGSKLSARPRPRAVMAKKAAACRGNFHES